MTAFRTPQEADRFANRAKHREFDEGDIEAVYDQARAELIKEECARFGWNDYEPSNAKIEERCIRILENPE